MVVVIKKKISNQKQRKENLCLLRYEQGSAEQLASKIPLSLKTLNKYFAHKSPSNISDSFARKLEKVLGKPIGWMDRKNYDIGLTTDEWMLLTTYRESSERDQIILSGMVNLIGAVPKN